MSHGQHEHVRVICPPAVATLGTARHRSGDGWLASRGPGQVFMMGDNTTLPAMPERPTLADFFRRRLALDPFTTRHMLQSARRAREQGMDDRVVLACLLHDISVAVLMRSHHGHWGAQLVEPYVDEEVAWAVREHETLRYFPDESVGYGYPEAYSDFFGAEYRPPAHTRTAYEAARRHRWYMSARMVTVNDLYTFDPEAEVDFQEFEDVVGRHFRQPAQGLGFDGSPVAHMWRTMIWPNNFL
ncbi:HD domain-containing protein [Streptomyces sp. NPDC020807]|uniref:HD domain-containing protein n=1 Tax=Streptomyces sp. NPDC020807 TaxID=3155119 RepID=UPI0033E5C81C